MFFALCSLLIVVTLRLWNKLAMPINGNHHRRLCTSVDVFRSLGSLLLPGTVVKSGHAKIERQAAFILEAVNRTDFARQFRFGNGAKAGNGFDLLSDD